MAKFYDQLNSTLREFIAQQHLFFVASAPEEGRVNLSPKGMDSLRCFNDNLVGYLDLTGSGNETAAHLSQNGRMTMMFCSFGDKAMILRLYGQGKVIHPRDAEWEEYYPQFPSLVGARQIILLKVEMVQTSCGFGVPIYEHKGIRNTLIEWAEHKGEEEMQKYREQKNQTSIDGLPTHLLTD